MKLYLYYLHDKKLIRDYVSKKVLFGRDGFHTDDIMGKPIVLYASTTQKKIAKDFERTRNMNQFTKIVQEYDDDIGMRDDIGHDCINNISYRDLIDGELCIPITTTEQWCLDDSSEIFWDEVSRLSLPPIGIFSHKNQKMLKWFQYGHYTGDYDMSGHDRISPGEDPYLDDVRVFFWIFRDILNLEAILAERIVNEQKGCQE